MRSRGRLALVMLLAIVLATCYSAIKVGLDFAPPIRFAGLRALIGGAALLAVTAAARQPLLPPRRLWPGIVALASAGTFFAYGAMFLSPGRTGAGIASVLGNTMPLIVIALAAWLLDESLTCGKVVAVITGFVGVSLIAYPAITDPARSGALGALLPLMAATGFSVATVLLKRMDVGDALLRVAAWQMLLGGAPLLGISEWVERDVAIVWNSLFLSLLLFLGIIGTAAATALWYWLLQRDEVGRLSLALFLVPVFGLALAGTIFGERIGPIEVLGVVLTIGGIGLVFREPDAS